MIPELLKSLKVMVSNKEMLLTFKTKVIQLFNMIMGRYHPIFHVICDSHGYVFAGEKFFIVHPIGPATAYKLRYRGGTLRAKEKLFGLVSRLNKRSIIITTYGDLDCRIHIHKQFKLNDEKIPIRELIRRTVVNYCIALRQLKKLNKKVIALSIPPASYQKNIYNAEFYAPQKLRAQMYREYNDLLAEECKRTGIKFVNTYKYLADERGFTRKEYLRDEIHLNKKYIPFFIQELKNLMK